RSVSVTTGSYWVRKISAGVMSYGFRPISCSRPYAAYINTSAEVSGGSNAVTPVIPAPSAHSRRGRGRQPARSARSPTSREAAPTTSRTQEAMHTTHSLGVVGSFGPYQGGNRLPLRGPMLSVTVDGPRTAMTQLARVASRIPPIASRWSRCHAVGVYGTRSLLPHRRRRARTGVAITPSNNTVSRARSRQRREHPIRVVAGDRVDAQVQGRPDVVRLVDGPHVALPARTVHLLDQLGMGAQCPAPHADRDVGPQGDGAVL